MNLLLIEVRYKQPLAIWRHVNVTDAYFADIRKTDWVGRKNAGVRESSVGIAEV